MSKITPPKAKQDFRTATYHGDTVTDPYHWLRSAHWQELLQEPHLLEQDIREHLDAENVYALDYMAQFMPLADTLEVEMKGRIIQNEASVPLRDGAWEYWSEFRVGGNYSVYKRRNIADGREQIIYDGDKESVGNKFFNVGGVSHSHDQKYALYSLDKEGSEYFSVRFRDIETGVELPETIKNTNGSVVWSADSSYVYYLECDERHFARFVKCHKLGTDPKDDLIIYEELDKTYSMGIGKSQSGGYIFIESAEKDTSEVSYIRADAPMGTKPTLINARKTGHEYHVDHHGDHFYIKTDTDGATNGKIMRTRIDAPSQENWEDVIPHDPTAQIEGFTTLKDYLVRFENKNALPRIVVSDYNGNEYVLKFDDEAYTLSMNPGYEYDTKELRVGYSTPAEPGKVFDINLDTQAKTLRKERILPNGHNAQDYVVERRLIKARDGIDIPVTILRHRDTPADGTAPLYLYGYGSYGYGMPASFKSTTFSMVDRGVVYAVGHIRGGNEMGQEWYLNGKMAHKQNTFNDFADVAEGLVQMGYGQKSKIIIEGRSAGGMLMGTSLNQRPDLWGGIVAGVPFVDIMNTMLDKDLPLTPGEWTEWGDPINDKDAYFRMKSYCPYSNVANQQYPVVFARAGLTDYRVTYWEAAKWIAKLREVGHGGPFIFKIDMSSGHFGSAARFESLREDAEDSAFALNRFEELGYTLGVSAAKKNGPVQTITPNP